MQLFHNFTRKPHIQHLIRSLKEACWVAAVVAGVYLVVHH